MTTEFKYFSEFECEVCLPWEKLTDRLEVAMEQFSKREIVQPIRSTLPINEFDGTFREFNLNALPNLIIVNAALSHKRIIVRL